MDNEEIYILTKRTIPALRQEWEDTVYYVHHEETESTSGTEETQNTADTQGTEAENGTEPETQLPVTEETPVTPPEESESQEPEPQEPVVIYIKVTTNDVFVRSGPGTNHSGIGKVNKDEKFEKIGEEDGWTKIKYKDGEGYIKSTFVEEVTE